MIKSDLAQAAVYVNLIFILRALDLHLALDVLSEFEHVLFLGHQLVLEHAAPTCGLVVFHHVDFHEILTGLLPGLLDPMRLLLDLEITLNSLESSFWGWLFVDFWLSFRSCTLLCGSYFFFRFGA